MFLFKNQISVPHNSDIGTAQLRHRYRTTQISVPHNSDIGTRDNDVY